MQEKIFLDIECYPNYFLVKFTNLEGKVREYEMSPFHPDFDRDSIRRIMNTYTTVTFNGRNYDFPMLAYALSGADNHDLKEASDALIVDELKPWNFYRHFKCQELSYDHIDIQEVAPGVLVSLKSYGGRLHMPKMQDLPYDPSIDLTREQMAEVKLYCGNDLATTVALYKEIIQRVELREQMSAEYRTDLRSKSDAQVAEAVIKAELFRLNGKKLSKPSPKEQQFFYKTPSYMRFETPKLQEVLAMVARSPFTAKANGQIEMTEELAKTLITIGDTTYKLGIGGLHSQESEQSVTQNGLYRAGKLVSSHEDVLIVDRDVTSYYPSIILNQELFPEKLGRDFLEVFRVLVKRRIEAKQTAKELEKKGLYTKDEQKQLHGQAAIDYFKTIDVEEQTRLDRAVTVMDSLRITINGAFGKLGSAYSQLYSPDLMVQVTVTGQLTLLMLIERLELAGIPVVSANTDGLVSYYPRSRKDEVAAIVSRFEAETLFQFEDTEYLGLYSRDVNNYVAIKTDGKIKTKGAFGQGGLMKNPQTEICNEAFIEHIKDGKVSLGDTIRDCKDITKFITIRTVRGGGVFGERYLGKVARWYIGTSGNGTINYRISGNKVPKSDGAVPLMDLPVDFPSNVDYNYYVNEANELLMDVGLIPRPPKVRKTRSKKL
jgi:hypothetical protein